MKNNPLNTRRNRGATASPPFFRLRMGGPHDVSPREELADAHYRDYGFSPADLLERSGNPKEFAICTIAAATIGEAEHLYVGIDSIQTDAESGRESLSSLLSKFVQAVREKLAEGCAYTHLVLVTGAECAEGRKVIKRLNEDLRSLASEHHGLNFVGSLEG